MHSVMCYHITTQTGIKLQQTNSACQMYEVSIFNILIENQGILLLEKKKAIPLHRSLCHLYFYSLSQKSSLIINLQAVENKVGDLINFPANTLFDLRPTLHFKTPQIRYCKPPAGPQHKARHLIKSWNGTCQVCLRGCVTIAVHTTCLFRPRLNY